METSIHTDALPDELQSYIHEDFRENECFYWKIRDKLLETYRGEWIVLYTGSDGTGLSIDDCQTIQLFESPYLLSFSKGVGATTRIMPIYQGFAEINSLKYPALIKPYSDGVVFRKGKI